MARLAPALTPEKITSWWEKLPHRGDFWGFYAGTTEEGFRRLLTDCPFVIEIPHGIVRVGAYRPGGSAEAHVLLWSRQGLRDLASLEEAVKMIFALTMASRVTLEIPVASRVLRKLAETMQFHAVATITDGLRTTKGCFDTVRYARIKP